MPSIAPSRWAHFRPYLIVLGLIALIGLGVWLTGREPARQTIAYGRFKELLNEPGLGFADVHVGRSEIRGRLSTPEGKPIPESAGTALFRVSRLGVEADRDLFARLDQRVPNYSAEQEQSASQMIVDPLLWIVMFVSGVLVLLFLMRWVIGHNRGGLSNFGRSKHKTFGMKEGDITFEHVAGIEEAKTELREVVDFLKQPERYQRLGGRIPKGVLLVGPPGTGKTLLARAVAGEAGVPFFSMSGSDFVEMYAGVGASRVRDLFQKAVLNAPCIIFIDELDAMGKSRSGQTHVEEREQTLNQLLVEMDGFDSNRGVIMMAATNRPEVLDAALLRPGRFDRTVVVDRPDVDGREAILKVHARNVKVDSHLSLRKVASLTPGSVGADLANLVNEAALLAARGGKQTVTIRDFDEAIERSAVGLERKSRIMSPDEKRRVAVHEAGHALVACAVPGSDPVHKVSIIPRGMAGGYVLQRPEGDRSLMTRSELEARIKVALAGTLAEEQMLGETSTGAVGDLQKVAEIAQRMVREFGMSRLGRVYHSVADPAFLPGGGMSDPGTSPETAREIDLEVRHIIEGCQEEVHRILERGGDALEAVAMRLEEREVIDAMELLELLTIHNFPVNESNRRGILEHSGSHPRPVKTAG